MVSMCLTAEVQEGRRSETVPPERETRTTTEMRLLKLPKPSGEANRRDSPRLFSKRLLPQCGATWLLPQATRALSRQLVAAMWRSPQSATGSTRV